MSTINNASSAAAGRQFWRGPRITASNGLRLGWVCRCLHKKFNYLNPKGLSRVESLRMGLRITEQVPSPNENLFDFYIHSNGSQGSSGMISFVHDTATDRYICNALFPNLRRNRGIGGTLFALTLLRGNALAGKTVELISPSVYSVKMAMRMKDFFPCIAEDEEGRGADKIVLTVPRLRHRELAAVEWYWRNVLQMEIG